MGNSMVRYSFSDLLISDEQVLPKYIEVFDTKGKKVGEVEVYFICIEDEIEN
jgi:hypothetical protein